MGDRYQCIRLDLKVQAPILTNTSGAIKFGLDATMRRDRLNRPAFPGSLIKGNLRHAWEDLNAISGTPSLAFIGKWLGAKSSDSRESPHEGGLGFPEFLSDLTWQADKSSERRYRISIDETTGAAATGALQVLESPYIVGEQPVFTGYINAFCSSDEIDELQKWVKKGLQFVSAIGALKTNGFGKLLSVDLTPQPLTGQVRKLPRPLAVATRLRLRIKPTRPFCFAKPHIGAGNHFEAESHIPAGAIVAAIARRLRHSPGTWPLLEKYLDYLSVTHARPVQEGAEYRPIALPLSMVKVGGRFLDIATEPDPVLIEGEAPLFSIDWKQKDFEVARKLLLPTLDPSRAAQPESLLEIRTEIDRETGTARENRLFSREEVVPDGFDWLSILSLKRIVEEDKRQQVVEQLHDLLRQPLTHLGKTKASANVVLEASCGFALPEKELDAGTVSIYLQSPARLLPAKFQCQGVNDGNRLKDAYAAAWTELSGGILSLNHFFAQQKLLGGSHWWKRFGQTDSSYHPELFTTEGSVFVLAFDGQDKEKVHLLLQQWRETGLPQLADAPGGERWEQNPWIAANGYGEIAINLRLPSSGSEDSTND